MADDIIDAGVASGTGPPLTVRSTVIEAENNRRRAASIEKDPKKRRLNPEKGNMPAAAPEDMVEDVAMGSPEDGMEMPLKDSKKGKGAEVGGASASSSVITASSVTKPNSFEILGKSLVKIYNHSRHYDYDNPWAAPKQAHSYGSGFIISGRRIVTNAHVVSNSTFVQVRKAGTSQKFPATIKRIMHSVDLAILELAPLAAKPPKAGKAGAAGGGKSMGPEGALQKIAALSPDEAAKLKSDNEMLQKLFPELSDEKDLPAPEVLQQLVEAAQKLNKASKKQADSL